MIDWTSNPIVSCTAVLSSKISCYVSNNPVTSNKPHFAVCTILQHSGPGNVWGWFTNCITEQIQNRSLTNSLVITRWNYSWRSWKERNTTHNKWLWISFIITMTNLFLITFLSKYQVVVNKCSTFVYVMCDIGCVQCSYYQNAFCIIMSCTSL